jgi:hypothetical protein
MYGEKFLLALESMPYFLATISTTIISGGYVKDFAMEASLGKEAINLYNSFVDLTRK